LALQLHDDLAFEHVDERMGVVPMTTSCAPGGYDTSIMRPSLPEESGRSIANSSFTSAASAGTAASSRSAVREAQMHTWSFFMVFLSES